MVVKSVGFQVWLWFVLAQKARPLKEKAGSPSRKSPTEVLTPIVDTRKEKAGVESRDCMSLWQLPFPFSKDECVAADASICPPHITSSHITQHMLLLLLLC